MMLQAVGEMSGFRPPILWGWSSRGRLWSPSSLDIPQKRPILSKVWIAGKVAAACRSRAQFIVLERWPRDVGRIETPVVSAASDETYLRPENDYCQLPLASRDGAACRRLHPQTSRPPAAPGAADGPPTPALASIPCGWSDACGTGEGVAAADSHGRSGAAVADN